MALTNYIINRTDPLNGSMLVQPNAANGTIFPTSATLDIRAVSADTSLLFIGKGNGDYGERFGENVLQLLENFAGASEPVNAIKGQLWFSQLSYWREIGTPSASSADTFYLWDGATWNTVVVTDTPSSIPPIGAVDGDYWFDTSSTTLYQLSVIADPHAGASNLFLTRQWRGDAVAPTLAPEEVLTVFDGTDFILAGKPFASDLEPLFQETGSLWFDTTANQLKVKDVGAYVSTAYPFVNGAAVTTVDAGTNLISNVVDPAGLQDAATKNYVDTLVTGGIGAIDTDVVSNVSTVPGATTTIALDALLRLDGVAVMTGALDMGTNQISNVVDPSLLQDVATKNYVDTAVSGGGADGVVTSGTVSTAGVLTLVISGGSFPNVVITNFDLITRNAVSIVNTPAGNISATNVQAALNELDVEKAPIDSPTFTTVVNTAVGVPVYLGNATPEESSEATSKSYVDNRQIPVNQVLDATGVNPYITAPSYTVGYNNLWVFLNGIKQIASTFGTHGVNVLGLASPNAPTGLAAIPYTFNVSIDGAPNALVTINGALATTYKDLINEINISAPFIGVASVIIRNGNLLFASATPGTGSDIFVTDITLFAAILPFPGTPDGASVPGTTYAYDEDGIFGQASTQITMVTTPPVGQVLEFLVV